MKILYVSICFVLLLTGCQSSNLQRGFRFFERKDYHRAIRTFDRVIQNNTDDEILKYAYFYRGFCYLDLNNIDFAIRDFSKSIDLDTVNGLYEAYYNRGLAYHKKGLDDKALNDFKSALTMMDKLKKTSKAKMISKDRLVLYNTKLEILLSQNKYEELVDDCKILIKLYPNDYYAYNNYSCVLSGCPDSKYRNGKQAIEMAQKALELVKVNKLDNAVKSNVLSTLAAAYARLSDFNKAISLQKQSIALSSLENKEKREKTLEGYEKEIPWILKSQPNSATKDTSDLSEDGKKKEADELRDKSEE